MNEQPNSQDNHPVIQIPGGVLAGATYPFRALFVLQRSPHLWSCILLPVLLNIVIGGVLYVSLLLPGWKVINQGWQLASRWFVGFPTWVIAISNVVDDVLRAVLAVLLFIVTGLLLVQFGAILGAPWYGNLAEQVERIHMGSLPVTGMPTLSRALQDIWRALAFQGKKLLLAIGLGLPLLLLNFLPGLGNGIASVGGIALAATLVCLDFLDPPLERRRLSFRTKLQLFLQTLPASASFGLACLGLVSVPLLNLLMVPLCIIAGTLFCCDQILPRLSINTQKAS